MPTVSSSSLRPATRDALLDALEGLPMCSRRQLSALCGVGYTTVTALCDRLTEAGLLTPSHGRDGTGRRACGLVSSSRGYTLLVADLSGPAPTVSLLNGALETVGTLTPPPRPHLPDEEALSEAVAALLRDIPCPIPRAAALILPHGAAPDSPRCRLLLRALSEAAGDTAPPPVALTAREAIERERRFAHPAACRSLLLMEEKGSPARGPRYRVSLLLRDGSAPFAPWIVSPLGKPLTATLESTMTACGESSDEGPLPTALPAFLDGLVAYLSPDGVAVEWAGAPSLPPSAFPPPAESEECAHLPVTLSDRRKNTLSGGARVLRRRLWEAALSRPTEIGQSDHETP